MIFLFVLVFETLVFEKPILKFVWQCKFVLLSIQSFKATITKTLWSPQKMNRQVED